MNTGPMILDVLTELQLEQAFARLDYDAIRNLFEAEVAKRDAMQDEVWEAQNDMESAQGEAKEAEEARLEAETKKDEAEAKVEKLEAKMDAIFDLVIPLVEKKTRVKVIKEIYEVVKP